MLNAIIVTGHIVLLIQKSAAMKKFVAIALTLVCLVLPVMFSSANADNKPAQQQQQQPTKKLVILVPGQGIKPMTSCPSAYCDQGQGDCTWLKVSLMNIAFRLGHDAMK